MISLSRIVDVLTLCVIGSIVILRGGAIMFDRMPYFASKSELLTIVRFAMVGGSATLVYLTLSFTLLSVFPLDSALINSIALTISLITSYLGHYYLTYRQRSRHAFFAGRYLVATGVVALGAVVLQQLLAEQVGINPYFVALLIAVYYPIASFVINHFWAFLRGR